MILRWIVILIMSASALDVVCQQTTNTNCSTVGNNINCTSNTTDYSAQQQRAYEQGQQVGAALGEGIGAAMQAHSFNKGLRKYCAAHPGNDWHYYDRLDHHTISSGHCPSDSERAVEAANLFMAHHKEYIRNQDNSQNIVAYLDTKKLNPTEQKSYERAYSDLRKSGKLELYSK